MITIPIWVLILVVFLLVMAYFGKKINDGAGGDYDFTTGFFVLLWLVCLIGGLGIIGGIFWW